MHAYSVSMFTLALFCMGAARLAARVSCWPGDAAPAAAASPHLTSPPCLAWPVALRCAGFMGITATAGAKAFSHTFSLVLTFTILTNLTQYTYWKCKSGRSG